MAIPKTLKLWQQQPNERQAAYSLFVSYRDMQNRSIAKLAVLLGKKSPRALERMSKTYQWQARVRAWDIELDRRLREMTVDDVAKMRKRHINYSLGMQTAAAKELNALVHKVELAVAKAQEDAKKKGLDPEKAAHDPVLSLNELLRLFEYGINLERLSRGEVTDRTGVQEELDLSNLSVKDLRALKQLQNKIRQ